MRIVHVYDAPFFLMMVISYLFQTISLVPISFTSILLGSFVSFHISNVSTKCSERWKDDLQKPAANGWDGRVSMASLSLFAWVDIDSLLLLLVRLSLSFSLSKGRSMRWSLFRCKESITIREGATIVLCLQRVTLPFSLSHLFPTLFLSLFFHPFPSGPSLWTIFSVWSLSLSILL